MKILKILWWPFDFVGRHVTNTESTVVFTAGLYILFCKMVEQGTSGDVGALWLAGLLVVAMVTQIFGSLPRDIKMDRRELRDAERSARLARLAEESSSAGSSDPPVSEG